MSIRELLRNRFIELMDDLSAQRWRLIGVVIVVAALTGWVVINDDSPSPTIDTPAQSGLPRVTTTSTSRPSVSEIVVQVSGAVVKPGVFRLDRDTRLGDVVAKAGGFGPDADTDSVNMASKLTDGQFVYVKRRGQTSVPSHSSGPTSPTDATSGSVIDINIATDKQLEELPGVGPATAKAIIDYRQKYGPFRSVDDLSKVRGIGPSKIAQLRDRARV